MATKKKSAKATSAVTITPKIPDAPRDVLIVHDLGVGECYLWGGLLMMKVEGDDQPSISLKDGELYLEMCEQIAIPVGVEIKWAKQK